MKALYGIAQVRHHGGNPPNCHSQFKLSSQGSNISCGQPVAVADLHSKILDARPPPRVQILSISCSFSEILAKSYVGAPRGVGAPSSGKSWIHHCVGWKFTTHPPNMCVNFQDQVSFNNRLKYDCRECVK